MNIDNTRQTSTASTTANTATSSNGAAGMNNLFMQLLVAQIQNQDPLNPTDGTEYVSQLAQLTQVQSMETMSQLMANNAVLMDNLQTLSTGNLVGQSVMVQASEFDCDGSTVVNGRLTLGHAAGVVKVEVKDEAGTKQVIELGAQEAGQVDFTIDPDALGLKPGKYTLTVVTDTEETSVPTELAGIVSSVRIPLDGSATLLNVKGLGEVAYHQITQFGESPAAQRS